MHQSIKVLSMKTSMPFKFISMLFHSFFFFLNYQLILFNPTAELIIPTRIPTKEAKIEI